MNIIARILFRICIIPVALAMLAIGACLVAAVLTVFAVLVPFICLFGTITVNGRKYRW